MLSQFLLFLFSIGLGALLGALYALLSFIARRTKLKAMRYIFDVLWCAASFVCFGGLTMLMGGGKFETFTLIGLIAGLGVAGLIFAKAKIRSKKGGILREKGEGRREK